MQSFRWRVCSCYEFMVSLLVHMCRSDGEIDDEGAERRIVNTMPSDVACRQMKRDRGSRAFEPSPLSNPDVVLGFLLAKTTTTT
jgi:hypothetical protein